MGTKWLPEDDVQQELTECFHFIESKKNGSALLSLLTRSDAALAFEKLKKKAKNNDVFLLSVKEIGMCAARAFHPQADKLTAAENRESCEEAAKLANRLSLLIYQNSNLRPFLDEAAHPKKTAALQLILDGVLYQNLSFTEEAEKSIDSNRDTIQHTIYIDDGEPISFSDEFNYSEYEKLVNVLYKSMDTPEAYRVLRGYGLDQDDLRFRLDLFASKATEAADWSPITPRAKSDNVDMRIFSIALCRAFDGYCGSPNYELVAEFAHIIFDKSVESDTIKKWLKRDGDNSPP